MIMLRITSSYNIRHNGQMTMSRSDLEATTAEDIDDDDKLI